MKYYFEIFTSSGFSFLAIWRVTDGSLDLRKLMIKSPSSISFSLLRTFTDLSLLFWCLCAVISALFSPRYYFLFVKDQPISQCIFRFSPDNDLLGWSILLLRIFSSDKFVPLEELWADLELPLYFSCSVRKLRRRCKINCLSSLCCLFIFGVEPDPLLEINSCD